MIYPGNSSHDPIGLVKHFEAWLDYASHPERTFPILFINLNNLVDTSSISVLLKFLNISHLKDSDFKYKPSKRKSANLIEVKK